MGNLGPNTPNHVQEHMKSHPKFSAPCFTSNETFLKCESSLWVELYLFHRYSGIGGILGNWAQILQMMHRDARKVIQSFQLLFSNQMRLYSSVRVLFKLSYTCFSGTEVLGPFQEAGPEYSKSCAGHMKSNPKFSARCFIFIGTLV